MTLNQLDSIWLSDSPDTDCQVCGLRYFAECARCKKLVCTWCSFICEVEKTATEIYLCKGCKKPSEGAR